MHSEVKSSDVCLHILSSLQSLPPILPYLLPDPDEAPTRRGGATDHNRYTHIHELGRRGGKVGLAICGYV